MLGVDLVIPDVSYLEKNIDKVRGFVLTHGHEDHIGALPYVLKTVNKPVWGTRLTVGIVANKLSEHTFKEKPVLNTVEAGDVVKLVRSEDPNDSIYFIHRQAATLTYNEVVKKDTVVFHGGERYHCYVYVNPSRLKVYKTSYTDEGIAVENVYYDNVIHICVYKGKVCLFSRDYTRKSFTGLVPSGFLNQAILSNMVFSEADPHGCHFNATVCIPDDASCYMVNICVGYDGKPTMELLEY